MSAQKLWQHGRTPQQEACQANQRPEPVTVQVRPRGVEVQERLMEGFLEGITRIHHAAGEKWRRENKNRILLRMLRGECLKWAATTIVLDNGGALAERQQSLCSDAKQKLAKACGHAAALDVFGSCFC